MTPGQDRQKQQSADSDTQSFQLDYGMGPSYMTVTPTGDPGKPVVSLSTAYVPEFLTGTFFSDPEQKLKTFAGQIQLSKEIQANRKLYAALSMGGVTSPGGYDEMKQAEVGYYDNNVQAGVQMQPGQKPSYSMNYQTPGGFNASAMYTPGQDPQFFVGYKKQF